MANKVFKPNGKQALSSFKLSKYWFESGFDEAYDESRISGNMCDCNGNGEFELEPRDSVAVIEGGKDYMVCRTCGLWSHL